MSTETKLSRREQILQALAAMLENKPGARITTAALAKEVGVSEAALYRHFPSKTKMFEGLIEFIEETLFSRINLILSDNKGATESCYKVLLLILSFAERNPGLSRIFTGSALVGEQERLQSRITQLHQRLETQLKQIIREAELKEGLRSSLSPQLSAELLLSTAEGKINQFVRSNFKLSPCNAWPEQWALLSQGLWRQDS